MARKPLIRSNEHYYHVTARSNNKEDFYLPKDEVWKIMVRKLRLLQIEHDLKVSAFVLMDNHFHLLLLTPKESIDRIMYLFMKDVTRELQKRTGRINKIFGGRYKGCLIENERYLLNVYKYILRNPVAAGMTRRVEEYRFSTFNCADIPLDNIMPISILISRKVEVEWVNSSFQDDEVKSVKWGLRRTQFQYQRASRMEYIEPVILF